MEFTSRVVLLYWMKAFRNIFVVNDPSTRNDIRFVTNEPPGRSIVSRLKFTLVASRTFARKRPPAVKPVRRPLTIGDIRGFPPVIGTSVMRPLAPDTAQIGGVRPRPARMAAG